MFEKYYKELDLPNNSTDEEVKKAYKKMAIKHHPDKHANSSEQNKQEAEEKFKKIAEAYEVLTNKEKHMPSFVNSNFSHSAVDPYELFNQIFRNMNIGQSMGNMHQGMNVSINMPGNIHTVMRSTSISIVNGKKVETINETINGVTHKKVIVSDLNNDQQQMPGNFQNIIFRHI